MLIGVGLLMFLFVGYQLWGTGIQEAQSQNKLESSFKDASAQEAVPRVPSTIQEPIFVDRGDGVFLIQMPTINVAKYVVAGVETADLKKVRGITHRHRYLVNWETRQLLGIAPPTVNPSDTLMI